MVKNKEGLGRSLVKSRFGNSRGKKKVDNGSMLHTTAVQDGYEWGRLNLQSVTEESSFQEFLSTAELANTEFQAEKLNVKFVSAKGEPAMSAESRAKAAAKHRMSKHLLRIPRRPKWSKDMTAEQVNENEKSAFLDWRRNLALVQENDNMILTPYEKNLEFWRQLWRVLERSDVLIQVVDARNPLLFRCEDLENYAKELGVKACMLLLNKSDLLSEKQRRMWAQYFHQQGVKVAFFSAALAAEKNKINNKIVEEEDLEEEEDDDDDDEDDSEEEKESEHSEKDDSTQISNDTNPSKSSDDIKTEVEHLEESVEKTSQKLSEIIANMSSVNVTESVDLPSCSSGASCNRESMWDEKNSTEILDRDKLVELLRSINIKVDGRLTIGLVGYPNVGKSSTINALMTAKKVSVSATPGKTKHFQTLLLEDDLMLCDCPGLVLPSFVCTKADMVVHGILPIDHMREYMDAIGLVTESLGGRRQAERRLAILLPPPPPEEPDALPPRDVLNAYAYSRGMMTGMGTPDCARAARCVLRAATKGLLPLAVVPPGFDAAEYMSELYPPLPELPAGGSQARREMTPKEARALKMNDDSDDIDRKFFLGNSNGAYTKGVPGKFHGMPTARKGNVVTADGEIAYKSWKQINKHINKNKKEKTRKTYFYLDQH